MGNMDLWVWPAVSLVLFLLVYAQVVSRAWRCPREERSRRAMLAVWEDEPAAGPREESR